MVQIEELPDDFEESMNLTDTAAPSTTGTPSAHADTSKTGGTMMTAPELPPALAQQQQQQQHDGKSPSELWASLNRTPLFMTSIDESDGAGGENVELEALKALAYEGPPLEVTANFKEQGNDCFREKRWKDAVEFYTKGLAVVLDERRKKGEKSAEIARPDGSDRVLEHGGADLKPRRELVGDEKEMAKMKEILLLNRAACNLELQNYRRTITDCAAAIRLNPFHPSPKAYYRTTVALLRLSKLEEADDAVIRGLHLAPQDPALLRLRREVDQRRKVAEEERRRRTEREERVLREKTALQMAIRQRGWVLVNSGGGGVNNGARSVHQETVDLQDARITLADAVDPKSVLHVPLLFLYPMAAQSDFIKSVPETATLAEELGLVLPVPWEQEEGGPASSSSAKVYQNVASVECFVQTVPVPLASSAAGGNDRNKKRGLVKVGKKIEIGNIVGPSTSQPRETTGHTQEGSPSQAKRVFLEDGMLKVFVVPKRKTAEFIEEFKKRVLA